MMTPRIAITPGDLAGVGPDLCLRLAQQNSHAQWVAYADPEALKARAERLNISLTWHTFDPAQAITPHKANHIIVHPIDSQAPTTLGEPNPAQANYLTNSLTQAVQACQKGTCHALLTGPVNKGIINDGGIPFTGHTEFIADLTNAHPVMMLASKVLRVALVTTHLPLSEISHAITPERISKVVRIIHQDLSQRFGCNNPSILVTGLNPHAGEDGHLGREEIDTIIPTLKTLQAEGINCQGPYPADTIFLPKYLEQADAVLAMYHDQGLPVLKYSGFHEAINITLGLPIIRTSVDHGTAFDIAGTNQVDMGSMQMAYDTAVTLATNSLKNESNNGA